MSFDIQNIPSVIQGTAPQPGMYGKTAHRQFQGYLDAVQDEFVQTGNLEPANKLNQASIRYTPEGTVKKNGQTEEAIQNALAYSAADISQFDEDGDQALNRQEVLKSFLSPIQPKLDELETVLQDPNAPQAEKQNAFDFKNLIINVVGVEAANYIASIDTPDAEGHRDGVITADEAAAKLLFDDGAKQMFEDNAPVYKTIIDGLQAKSDYDGPSFEQMQQKVNEIAENNPNSTFAKDGQLTVGEREIANALTAAPIPTNEIVSQIHKSLDLKGRLEQNNPFAS